MEEAMKLAEERNYTFTHCEPRIVHAPGECPFCDKYATARQIERLLSGIAFSGKTPKEGEVACPADKAVQNKERDDYSKWPGNTPQGY